MKKPQTAMPLATLGAFMEETTRTRSDQPTAADFILLLADGLRAGRIRFAGGTAQIQEDGNTRINANTLEEEPKTLPISFTFTADMRFDQVE